MYKLPERVLSPVHVQPVLGGLEHVDGHNGPNSHDQGEVLPVLLLSVVDVHAVLARVLQLEVLQPEHGPRGEGKI